MSNLRSVPVSEYHIGIICALYKELAAVVAVLDEEHEQPDRKDTQDSNTYILGCIHYHNVVIVCLPAGIYGTNAAASVCTNLQRTFYNVRMGLMVGIGGGIPNLAEGKDVRLGDVVVSQPDGVYGGVVQIDLGKTMQDGRFERKGSLNNPPTILLLALSKLRSEAALSRSSVSKHILKAHAKHPFLKGQGYVHPGLGRDHLFCDACDSSRWWWALWSLLLWILPLLRCQRCEDDRVLRLSRGTTDPVIHYGVIASANQLLKRASIRDKIGHNYGAICIEMEAAGLMNILPCLVIRGICDYADSHKNDIWQEYAALVAASFAKELLLHVIPERARESATTSSHSASLCRDSNATKNKQKSEPLNQNPKEKEDYEKCHRLFDTTVYREKKNNNPERAPGTCQWVLNHPKYREWYDRPSSDLLWISADPGCGKSVLCRSLIDNELASQAGHLVCYFFFKDNEDQNAVSQALCALLHQLFYLEPGLIQYAIAPWKTYRDKLPTLIEELWDIFWEATSNIEASRLICVLDALDECSEKDRHDLIHRLCRFHQRAQSYSAPGVGQNDGNHLKFLVTSRQYSDISFGFGILDDIPTIHLRGEDESDQIYTEINTVIKLHVRKLARQLGLQSQIWLNLEEKLLSMEHRTYLWLYLSIEGICDKLKNSLRPVQEIIDNVPPTVEAAYEDILNKVAGEKRADVTLIFKIIVGAQRPLSIGEMAVALGISTASQAQSLEEAVVDTNHLERHIRQWCGLFVVINHAKIYLIHQTAKEFLVRKDGSEQPSTTWMYSIDEHEAELVMARICVDFLLLTVDRDHYPTDYMRSMYTYTAQYWHVHVRRADRGKLLDHALHAKLLKLYQTTTGHPFWTYNGTNGVPTTIPLHWAAFHGHIGTIQQLLIRERDKIQVVDDEGNTALIWACKKNHYTAVKVLLGHIIDSDISPVMASQMERALCITATMGYKDILSLLLHQGIDVNARALFGNTALLHTVHSNNDDILILLLGYFADPNSQDDLGQTALMFAAQKGNQVIVQALLDRGADINIRSFNGHTALSQAAWAGHEPIVTMLLYFGAHFDIMLSDDQSPLMFAAKRPHKKIIQMLLDHDVCTQAQSDGANLLDRAIISRHEPTIQLVIENRARYGIDINAQGWGNLTPLMNCTSSGLEKSVQRILGFGPDLSLEDNYGETALVKAIRYGHNGIAKLLLDHGDVVNGSLKYWRSQKHENFLVKLRGDGGCSCSRKARGTGIIIAVEASHHHMAQLLIDQEADVNAQGGVYGAAIHAAVAMNNKKMVDLLLDNGADPKVRGTFGTARDVALKLGYHELVEFLSGSKTSNMSL